MLLFLVIAKQLRIIKAFIFAPAAYDFIKSWNRDPENQNDQVHLETYEIDQGEDLQHYDSLVEKYKYQVDHHRQEIRDLKKRLGERHD